MATTVGVERLTSTASNIINALVVLNTDLVLQNPITELNKPTVYSQIYTTLGISTTDWQISNISLSAIQTPFTGQFTYLFMIRFLRVGTKDPQINQFQGPLGPLGPQGVPGARGVIGPHGSTGPTGPIGMVGPTGPQGIQGEMGSTGSIGPQGVTGPIGPQGEIGPTGSIGPQGVTGPIGPQGEIGPTGSIGPQGVTGTTVSGFQRNTYIATDGQVSFTLSTTPVGVALMMVDGIVQRASDFPIVGTAVTYGGVTLLAGQVVEIYY